MYFSPSCSYIFCFTFYLFNFLNLDISISWECWRWSLVGFFRSRYWDGIWGCTMFIRDQYLWRREEKEGAGLGRGSLWYRPGNTLVNLQGIWSKKYSSMCPSLGHHGVHATSRSHVTMGQMALWSWISPWGGWQLETVCYPLLSQLVNKYFWEVWSGWYFSISMI